MSKKKIKKIRMISNHVELSSQEKSIVSRMLSTNNSVDNILKSLISIFGSSRALEILEGLEKKVLTFQQNNEESNEV